MCVVVCGRHAIFESTYKEKSDSLSSFTTSKMMLFSMLVMRVVMKQVLVCRL